MASDRSPLQVGRDRRRGFSASEQLKVVGPLVGVWAIGFAVLAAVAWRGRVGELLLDPSYASGGAWYLGAVSQFGLLAWSVGTVAAAGGSWVLRRTDRHDAARFLAHGAVVGTLLLVDDMFGLHSGPMSALGLGKHVALVVLGGPIGVWLVVYRHDIFRTRWQVLACSLVGLGSSAVIDAIIAPDRMDLALILEDGPKFLGALAWATYFVITTKDIIDSALRAAQAGADRDVSGAGSIEGTRPISVAA
jgi:hypothetical protein